MRVHALPLAFQSRGMTLLVSTHQPGTMVKEDPGHGGSGYVYGGGHDRARQEEGLRQAQQQE